MHPVRFEYESKRTLERIQDRIQNYVVLRQISSEERKRLHVFESNLEHHWTELFRALHELYGHLYDFFYHLEQIVISACEAYLRRPKSMLKRDEKRLLSPLWYRKQDMVGATLYVDLFNKSLSGVGEKIDYLKDLGINYVHLMPLFDAPKLDSDGGYAVSNYREVDEKLGTIEDLTVLASQLHEQNISLALDFVFNHTSDEHQWAKRAQSGEMEFLDFYHTYETREIPDRYDATTREIFPTVRRGNFTWHDGMRKWVWTTFNSFQWDLRYANPQVFCAMMQEMLFLANLGVDILRLDAVAFIWKKQGTSCENLDEALVLLKAFNLIARIAAPSLIFKSEAIVHPNDVRKYISEDKCQLSYNPLLMATLWESIATRNTSLLKRSIQQHHGLPEGCAWVNYIRCHDDIGWTFDDDDAWQTGANPRDHRSFLNAFYTGEFEGSFSKGLQFQFNPENGDRRVCGSLASLCGLEQAIDKKNKVYADMAIKRMLVMYSVICTLGGIPLLYAGDEWGVLNDYSFLEDDDKKYDSRWVHRPEINWEDLPPKHRFQKLIIGYHQQLKQMFQIRKNEPSLAGVDMNLLDISDDRILGYTREHSGSVLIVLNNLSDSAVTFPSVAVQQTAVGSHFIDIYGGDKKDIGEQIRLEPYEFLWLKRRV